MSEKRPTVEIDPESIPDSLSDDQRVDRDRWAAIADRTLEIHAMLARECDEARRHRVMMENRLNVMESKIDQVVLDHAQLRSETSQLHECVGALKERVRVLEDRVFLLESHS